MRFHPDQGILKTEIPPLINIADMLTAHLSYWTDSSFAAFLLTEIFSTRLDLMRTGMGLANQPPPENGANI